MPHLLGARTLPWREVHGGMAASRPRSLTLRDVRGYAVTPELSAHEQRDLWREYAREHGYLPEPLPGAGLRPRPESGQELRIGRPDLGAGARAPT